MSGAINNVFSYFGSGHAEGQLTFTDNQNNSVTIAVRGPMQTGFSSSPQQFAYRVTSGTGPWANLSTQGTLTLTLQSQTASMTSISVPFAASPVSITSLASPFEALALPPVFLGAFGEQGTFTLSISADNSGFDALWGNDSPTGLPLPTVPADFIDRAIFVPSVPIAIDPIPIDRPMPIFFLDTTAHVSLGAVSAPLRAVSTIALAPLSSRAG